MIRSSQINLNYSNLNKKQQLLSFLLTYACCVNRYIDVLWSINKFSGTFVGRSIIDQVEVDTTFTAKQSSAQTALHIVKSQRKKKHKTKPQFRGKSFELDQRFITIEEAKVGGKFDLWIRINCLGLRKSLFFPTKRHKQFLKFKDDGWKLRKGMRITIRDDGQIFGTVFFEKEAPKLKQTGKEIGVDCGYKKLAVTSEGQMIGVELEQKIEKISRKKQKSKAFKRALVERNDYINREIKKINLAELKTVVIEDLKHVKKRTKGKIRKQFMNKLQRWTYPRLLDGLEQSCEVVGVQCHKVNPAYTSQTCSQCGGVHKENRNGELFKCKDCGYTADADYNASLNILNRFSCGSVRTPRQKDALALSGA